ncbi:uncharacterized protein LOC110905312 isoform X2 [Helianthus annuus]|uniref:uncharacterized protein LOC110905312 isoform X2 n=1 Tax=Helianthus annuus TaxID=4232 RepID=UPI0016530E76|nr:uncharacterized protein LOC110905312 isoform X2 [Helianthus annuus]
MPWDNMKTTKRIFPIFTLFIKTTQNPSFSRLHPSIEEEFKIYLLIRLVTLKIQKYSDFWWVGKMLQTQKDALNPKDHPHPKDDPEKRYQIQKKLQIRLKMFDVEDDVSDGGSMLKMIQNIFEVEHDVPDLKDPLYP